MDLFLNYFFEIWVSPVAQMVNSLPAMQETQVQSLGWENPLEKEMVTDTSILPGKPHGQRSLADPSPWTSKSWKYSIHLKGQFYLNTFYLKNVYRLLMISI